MMKSRDLNNLSDLYKWQIASEQRLKKSRSVIRSYNIVIYMTGAFTNDDVERTIHLKYNTEQRASKRSYFLVGF